MGEIGEMPQGPQPEQAPPQQRRLEDMPEFQKLAPEQQQKLLELRERMMQEAMEPKKVVSRSINEMGFWEGLGATMKPHAKKMGEILFKDLKARTSLVLSLIPIVGEGKAFLGISKVSEVPWSKLSIDSFKTGQAVFEPWVRGKNAYTAAKNTFNAERSYKAVAALKLNAVKNAVEGGKQPNILKRVGNQIGARAHDAMPNVAGVLAGKSAAEKVLVDAVKGDILEGPGKLAATIGAGETYSKVKKVAEEAPKIGAKAFEDAAKLVNLDRDVAWWDLVDRMRKVGQKRKVVRTANDAVKAYKNTELAGLSFAQKHIIPQGIERASQIGNTMPAFGETIKRLPMGLGKLLDMTPDVPWWLSTITGLAQAAGMHGIDAVSAVSQLGINEYQKAKLNMKMAQDVLGYTASRALGSLAKRKEAAQVFSAQPATG
jgi:hypothetical protein